MKYKSRNQRLGWVIFLCYLVCLSYLLFFAEAFGRTGRENLNYAYNLVLFREIRRFWMYREQLGWAAVMLNLLGNIVCFMPFGFFLPIISRRAEKWYHTVGMGASFSLFIESVQLVSKVGSFDVDDIFLNTIGVIFGYVIYALIQRIRIKKRKKRRFLEKTVTVFDKDNAAFDKNGGNQ